MKDKLKRLNAIREIITHERVGSQDELLKYLKAQGFELTQATLSRDLKQLKVVKVAASDGIYTYILPNNPLYKQTGKSSSPYEQPVRGGFVSISFSANIAVLKTRPGMLGVSPTTLMGTTCRRCWPLWPATIPYCWSSRRAITATMCNNT